MLVTFTKTKMAHLKPMTLCTFIPFVGFECVRTSLNLTSPRLKTSISDRCVLSYLLLGVGVCASH